MIHICTYLACRPELFPSEHRSERRTADRHFAIRWPTDEVMRVFVYARSKFSASSRPRIVSSSVAAGAYSTRSGSCQRCGLRRM